MVNKNKIKATPVMEDDTNQGNLREDLIDFKENTDQIPFNGPFVDEEVQLDKDSQKEEGNPNFMSMDDNL